MLGPRQPIFTEGSVLEMEAKLCFPLKGRLSPPYSTQAMQPLKPAGKQSGKKEIREKQRGPREQGSHEAISPLVRPATLQFKAGSLCPLAQLNKTGTVGGGGRRGGIIQQGLNI
jgi:hypothetical protein